jgi:hypothetical protein
MMVVSVGSHPPPWCYAQCHFGLAPVRPVTSRSVATGRDKPQDRERTVLG